MNEQTKQTETVLGFCDLPIPVTIFIGGSDDQNSEDKYCWYSLSADGQKIGHPQYGLRGYIRGLKTKHLVFKGDKHYKLVILMEAEKQYRIQVGINTTFSRGFLLALQQRLVDTGDIDGVFTLGVQKADDNKVVFAKLYSEDNAPCRAEWDKECKLLPIVHQLQTAFGQDLEVDNDPDCTPSKIGKKGK